MITEFPKNTRIIITILFSLFAMAVQAQVKSGLDLCLRDETTGEWLIGLFDEYAIYDCNNHRITPEENNPRPYNPDA